MIHIAGGRFLSGSDKHCPEGHPAHSVTAREFLIDVRRTVTKSDFLCFGPPPATLGPSTAARATSAFTAARQPFVKQGAA